VAAADPAIGLGAQPALQLHKALDLGAVGPDVRLYIGGGPADGSQVDAE
jgi:hypothetical protein